MDRQPAPPPFQRPPDSQTMLNPKYQPSTSQSQSQSYNTYPPATSQPQPPPQPPLHAPLAAPDPYSIPRRDPFFPAGPAHARKTSQGVPGASNAPQAQPEGPGGWPNTGTACTLFLGISRWTFSAAGSPFPAQERALEPV